MCNRWKCQASESNLKGEEVQCAQLLHYLGEEALPIYNTFSFQAAEQNKIEILLDFEQYFTCKQEMETTEQYVTKLNTRVNQCEFGDLSSDLVKAMYVNLRHERQRFAKNYCTMKKKI